MARRRPPSDYPTQAVAQQAIGHGNYVQLGEELLGPISLPEAVRGNTDLVLAGAASLTKLPSGTRVPAERAFWRIAKALRQSYQELQTDLAKARHESSVFFAMMCAFSVVGFCLVLASVGLLLWGKSEEGVIGAAASVISEALAAVFFKKDRELRRVVTSYHVRMYDYHRFLAMITVAETIEHSQERDRLKWQILSILLEAPAREDRDRG